MRTLTLSLAALLVAPAAASAHPGVYFTTAKIAATPEVQTLTPTGGPWQPTTGAATVASNATAAQVQAAFIPVEYDNVRVTGPDGGPYTVTFVGTKAGVNVAPLTPAGATGATVQDGGTPVTYSGNPAADQAAMADQQQAIVASDGYAIGYRETNGVGPHVVNGNVVGGGLLNLSKILPGAYRAPMSPQAKLAYLPAQTGIQLHATCSGVAALEDPNNIWAAWQRSDNDPFYNYIPWQSTSAGFGDDPAKWIAVVKNVTGVDLAKVSDFRAACQGLGGTYHPADTASNVTSAAVADATGPLNARIGSLLAQLATLPPAAPAPVRHLALTLTGTKLDPAAITAMVTGPAGQPVTVRLTVSQAVAKALHLKSATLATKASRINDQGAALVSLRTAASKLRTLKKTKGATRVSVQALSGAQTTSSAARLSI